MNWNQFQRELQKRNIDPQIAFMFGVVYERLLTLSKEMDQQASLTLQMAESLQTFATLSEQTQGQIKQLLKRGQTEGVEVKSVAIDPDTEH